ncbi:hypothetical protein [Aeromonas phage AS-szw]|uniref:Uncharacterized protein n=1 Tax=Aeromonas phage AS-szw TaxID=2026114 RepID=A0A291LDA9_9CAUD|nr:hypothetical protein [Aeromonas phage AS-szw]
MIDFDNVSEFYGESWHVDSYKYVKCEHALANLKGLFPNIKWVYVLKQIPFDGQEAYNPPTVDGDCLDICACDYVIVTEEGKIISLGTSEWGHLEEMNTDKFEVINE